MYQTGNIPVPLTDDHKVLWVDNGDGTVTNTEDENDGHPDQQWDQVDQRSAVRLHGYVCWDTLMWARCPGGAQCADDERWLMLLESGTYGAMQ